ncbi:hypothetical protein D3C77_726680 [compost metagenome]
MHDQRMKHPLPFAHIQGQGTLGTCGFFGEGYHLARMLVATGSNFVGDVVHFK